MLYLQLLRENIEQAGVQVLAYCLMTNHVHFVVVPEREDSLSVLFGRADGRYAQAVNIRKRALRTFVASEISFRAM